jgi:hypothetical protein
MRRIATTVTIALISLACGYAWGSSATTGVAAAARAATITRMFTGSDGETHFQETALPFGAPMQRVVGIQFNRVAGPQKSGGPDVQEFAFHNAPNRRYVITLSGSAEIEASGGGTFVADSQHVLVAEDLTGKGHRYTSHPLGNDDWVNIFVEIDQPKPAADAAR